jgi:hypothetical protein
MSKTLDDVTVLAVVAVVGVGGYLIYSAVSSAAQTVAGTAGGVAAGATSSWNAPFVNLWNTLTGNTSAANPPLSGLGMLVEMPHGKTIPVPIANVTNDGQFTTAGRTYQIYARRDGSKVAKPV